MSQKTESLLIPANVLSDKHPHKYLFENPLIEDLLGEEKSILVEIKSLFAELESLYEKVAGIKGSSNNFIYALCSLFSNENILRINRLLRAKKKNDFLEYLGELKKNLELRIGEKKQDELYAKGLLKKANPPPVTTPEIEPIEVPDMVKKTYIDFMEESIKNMNGFQGKIPLPIKEDVDTKCVNENILEIINDTRAVRDEKISYRHRSIVETNKIRINLSFLGPSHFSLIALDKSLDNFIDLVNRYQQWIDPDCVNNTEVYEGDTAIVLNEPLNKRLKHLITLAFALLAGVDHDVLFDQECVLRAGITREFLEEGLLRNSVLTTTGIDFHKMERILAGYE